MRKEREMSYRTYVNDVQVFGNNEFYPEWIDFIAEQGIAIDDDYCYEGEITDFMAALETVEKIVMRLEAERRENRKNLEERLSKMEITEEEKEERRKRTYGVKSLFDWTNTYDEINQEDKEDRFRNSLFDHLTEIVDSGYAFMPYALYKACEDKLEKVIPFSTNGHFHCFKIKDGEKIIVSAN